MFQVYCKQHRTDDRQKKAEFKFADIQKELSSNWNNLSDEEKATYKNATEEPIELEEDAVSS